MTTSPSLPSELSTSPLNLMQIAGSENPVHSNMSDKNAKICIPLTYQLKIGKNKENGRKL